MVSLLHITVILNKPTDLPIYLPQGYPILSGLPHVQYQPQTRASAGGQGHRPRGSGCAGGAGALSDETAAETARLATTLENLSQQSDLITRFEASGRALRQLEQATVLSRDKLAELRREQQETSGGARQLTDQERLLASEVKPLEYQLVAQSASHSRLHAVLTLAGLDCRGLIIPCRQV